MHGIPENGLAADDIENKILLEIQKDPNFYYYRSLNELKFEITLRKNIISSAVAMNQSPVSFEVFSTSRCNPKYWTLTRAGGFSLKFDVLPADAIEDIYINGNLYGFECATAIMIIYYHAVLKSIDQYLFNRLFQNLYLYSWHADSDLGIHSKNMDHILPGDVIYFNNPDFDPKASWLRGENAVVLDDGTFFAHGIGIQSGKEIIDILNENRKPGSKTSAYQTTHVTRPSFNYLSQFTTPIRDGLPTKFHLPCIHHNQTSIPCYQYESFLHQYFLQNNSL